MTATQGAALDPRIIEDTEANQRWHLGKRELPKNARCGKWLSQERGPSAQLQRPRSAKQEVEMETVEIRDPKVEFVDALADLLGEVESLAVLTDRIGNEKARGAINQWRRLRSLLHMSPGYSKDEAKQEIEKFIDTFVAPHKSDDTPIMLRRQAD